MATIDICALGLHLDRSTVAALLVLYALLGRRGRHGRESDCVHGGGDGDHLWFLLVLIAH
jgi:hypothetical protein